MRDLGPAPAGSWHGGRSSGDAPAGDREKGATTPLAHEATPPSGSDAAGGPFARTKVAVEQERADAERLGAWTHVLKTPEEVGASDEGWWRRVVRPPGRLAGAGPAADEPAAGRGAGAPAPTAARSGNRSAGGVRWPERGGSAFLVALGMAVLVTGLLLVGLLGLPEGETVSQRTVSPATAEDFPADPGRGERADAGRGVPTAQAGVGTNGARAAFEEPEARLAGVRHGGREPPVAAAALEVLVDAGPGLALRSREPDHPTPVLKPRDLVPAAD